MYENLSMFFADTQAPLDAFNLWLEKASPRAASDHICYKCGDASEFEHLRALFEVESSYIYQSIISKRRIAIIKFLKPLKTLCGDILFLELSDQKPDKSQTSGFDHIEIYPTEGTVEELVADLTSKGTVFQKVERPHHTTYDSVLFGDFKVRIEAEALIQKIKMTELN